MRKRIHSSRGRGVLALAVAGVLLATAGPAMADLGFQFDASTLSFQYTRNGSTSGLVGQIQIVENVASSLQVSTFDLGADSVFGGGNDALVDQATIGSANDFTTTFTADVYRNGVGDFSIDGTLTAADSTGNTVLAGDFASTSIFAGGGFFIFEGSLNNDDGLLRTAGGGEDWLFTGNAGDTADDILSIGDFGEDSVDGTTRLAGHRSGYQNGSVVDFQFTGFLGTMDQFFLDANRSSQNSDMKVQVVPAPAAMALAAFGLTLVGGIRRRLQG